MACSAHPHPRRRRTTGALGLGLAAAAATAAAGGGAASTPGTTTAAARTGAFTPTACGTYSGAGCAPQERRIDLDKPVFTDPTKITNPLFPIARLRSAVLLGEVDGKPFRSETTLLPGTRTVAWDGRRIPVLASQYAAFSDGRIEEVALDRYAQADDGSVWYFGEDVVDYRDGTISTTEGTWMAVDLRARPRRVLLGQGHRGRGAGHRGARRRPPRRAGAGARGARDLHRRHARLGPGLRLAGLGRHAAAHAGRLEGPGRPGPAEARRRADRPRVGRAGRRRRRSSRRRATQAAIDAGQSILDLRLRHRPAAEIDRARLELWTQQLLVHATARDAGGVRGAVATIEWIRDRVAHTLTPPARAELDGRVRAMRAAADAGALGAAADHAIRLGQRLRSL